GRSRRHDRSRPGTGSARERPRCERRQPVWIQRGTGIPGGGARPGRRRHAAIPRSSEVMSDTPTPPPPARSRLKVFITIALVIVASGGLLAWWMLGTSESTDDAQIDGHIVPTAARIQGTVLRVRIQDNQEVKAGDLLVELDPTDYALACARAEAELADARAAAQEAAAAVPVASATSTGNLSGARAGVYEAQAAIEAARAALNAATVRRAAAEARVTVAETADRKAAADLARFE